MCAMSGTMTTAYRAVVPTWTLADRLTKAREHAGLKQEELAELIEVSARTIGKYERGQSTPKRSTLMAWAIATNVPPRWLAEGVGAPGEVVVSPTIWMGDERRHTAPRMRRSADSQRRRRHAIAA